MDKTNATMTEEELVKILRDAAQAEPENEPNTLTVFEYAEAMGVSDYMARKQLNELCDSGELKRDYIARVNGWNVRQRVAGYRYTGNAA